MNDDTLLASVALTCLCLCLAGVAAPVTGAAPPSTRPLDAGETVATNGTYVVGASTTNATASTGVTIAARSVDVDGAGHRLDGRGTAGSVGIYAPWRTGVSSLVVRNLTLTDWDRGVVAENVTTLTLRGVEMRSTRAGLRVVHASTVRIENSTLVVPDGTTFTDVDRVVVENSTIVTAGTESITATNATVVVGRNVTLTGGVSVGDGVVNVVDSGGTGATRTALPTAIPRTATAGGSKPTAPPSGGGGGVAGGGGGGGGAAGVTPPSNLPGDGQTTAVTTTGPATATASARTADPTAGETRAAGTSTARRSPTRPERSSAAGGRSTTAGRTGTPVTTTATDEPGFSALVALAALWLAVVGRPP